MSLHFSKKKVLCCTLHTLHFYIYTILEMHIPSILDDKVMFSPNKIGFVKNVPTTEVCFLLKETIGNYISKNYPVYAKLLIYQNHLTSEF